MSNQDIAKLIPLYVANSLTVEERKLVEKELVASKELQEELRFWQDARATAIAHERFRRDGHPSAEEIVAYVERSPAYFDKAVSLENHLLTCEECREDVELIRAIYQPAMVPAEIFHRKPQLGRVEGWIKNWKITFAIPAIAIILLVVLLYWPAPEQKPEQPSIAERHSAFTLIYQSTVRDPSHHAEIPTLMVPTGTHIDFKITLPKPGIDSVMYSLFLTLPSSAVTRIADSLEAVSYDSQLSLLEVTLSHNLFTPNEKPYQILVSEILPRRYVDISPEEYRYLFLVADSLPKPHR